jgi:hypothetical protein
MDCHPHKSKNLIYQWKNGKTNLDCHRFGDIFHVVFLFYSRYSQPVNKTYTLYTIQYCSSSLINIATIVFELQYAYFGKKKVCKVTERFS